MPRVRCTETPIGDGAEPFTLDEDYLDEDYRETARTIAEERVALAGARLANVINGAVR